MPTYEYECKKCGEEFTVEMHMREQGEKKVECPKCHCEEVQHLIETVNVATSKKS